MSQQDWTVALDDGLVERLRQCTLCGRQPLAYFGLCALNATLVLGYVLCGSCRTQDPHLHHVEAALEARYGGPRAHGTSEAPA